MAEKELSEEREEEDIEVRLVWMEKDGGLMVRLPRPVPVKRLVKDGEAQQQEEKERDNNN